MNILLRHIKNLTDSAGKLAPVLGLGFELFAPCARQRVVSRSAVILGRAPFGFDPASPLQPVKSRV
jgi:hypothetical protein